MKRKKRNKSGSRGGIEWERPRQRMSARIIETDRERECKWGNMKRDRKR